MTLTTGLVSTNSLPLLIKSVEANKIDPEQLITHHFALHDIEKAYDVFGQAAKEHAIKVIMTNEE
ncbi:MAG TPA: hypothetical protein VJ546_08540 [Bacillales bacterium]|nr:hypothetical protein [Bacillales bacterium]